MVYTKTGDNGTTSLVGGQRVKKCHPRVESYGTVDELNAHMGLLAELLHKAEESTRCEDVNGFEELILQAKKTQNKLFVIQTLLATSDSETYDKLTHIDTSDVEEIEHWIDQIDLKLPKLKSFVIPGGSIASAQAHVARTVCRRAEREIVRLGTNENIEEKISKYINRLSDYLFVISRYILLLEKKEEIFWPAK